MSAATDRWLRPVTFITVLILFTYWLYVFAMDFLACNTAMTCAWHTPLISGITVTVLGVLAASGSDLCCIFCRKRTHQHIRAPKQKVETTGHMGGDRVDNGIELSGGTSSHDDMVSTTIGMVHADDISSSDGSCLGNILAACDEVTNEDTSGNTGVARRNRGKAQVMLLMVASYLLVGSIIMVVPAYTIFITGSAITFVISLWCAIYIIVRFIHDADAVDIRCAHRYIISCLL